MRKQIFLFSLFLYSFLGELIFTQEIEYTWKQEFYSQLAGKDALSFAQEMNVAKLCFIDIDSDEDLDLFLGKEDGKIAFFENQGSTVKPRLILQTQALDGIFFEFVDKKKHRIRKTIDVGNRSVPTLEDIDHDGDYDLLIGNQKGELWFFQNNGDNFIPKFELITKQFHTILAGKNVVPRFIDANLDQRYDLIIGNRAGELWLFMNQGTRKLALYDSVGQKISIHSENNPQKMSHISPSFVDWDNDGDLDLVIGQKNGSLSYLINSGDRFNPIWEPTNDAFPYLDIGGEAAPTFVDLEEDGNLDLFIGNINTPILFYENRPLEKGRELWKISANYFNFQKMILTGQRASITSGDLDQDGDMDLILGEAKGNLNYYENQGNNQKANWKLQTENMISMINIENSSPELGDIDADGDLDLLVGRHSGQISFIENIGTAKTKKTKL